MSRHVIAIVVAVSLFAGCGGDFAGDGLTAFAKGDTKTAADLLTIAHQGNPERVDVAIVLGVCLARARRTEEADVLLRPHVSNPTWRLMAVMGLTETLMEGQRHTEAIAVAQAAVDSAPSDLLLREALAICLQEQAQALRVKMRTALEAHVSTTTAGWVSQALWDLHGVQKESYDARLSQLTTRLIQTAGLTQPSTLSDIVEPIRNSTLAARKLFNECLADPNAFRARLELGLKAASDRNYDVAKSHLMPLIDMKMDGMDALRAEAALRAHDAALESLASLAIATGKADDAIALLTPRTNEDGSKLALLAEAYLVSKQMAGANSSIDKALDEDPRSPHANWVKGRILEAQGDVSNAVPYYRKASTLSTSLEYRRSLGFALLNSGEPDAAESTLRSVVQFRPLDDEAVIAIIDVLTKRGELEEARSYISGRLASIGDTRSPAFAKIRDVYRSLHKDVGADIKTLQEAYDRLRLDPSNPLLRIAVASFEFSESTRPGSDYGDRTGMALQRVEEVTQSQANIPEGWRLLARIRLHLATIGRLPVALAIEAAEVARRLAPDDAATWHDEARALQLARYADRAMVAARRCYELAPKEAWSRLLLAELDIEAGQALEAQSIATTLLAEYPKDARVLRLLGRARLQLDNAAGARDLFQTALDLDSNDRESEALLALASLRLGSTTADTRVEELAADQAIPISVRLACLKELRSTTRLVLAARMGRVLVRSMQGDARNGVERGAVLDAWWGGDIELAYAILDELATTGQSSTYLWWLIEVLTRDRAYEIVAAISRPILGTGRLDVPSLEHSMTAFLAVGSIRDAERVLADLRRIPHAAALVEPDELAMRASTGDRDAADKLLGVKPIPGDLRAQDRLREACLAMAARGDTVRAMRLLDALLALDQRQLDCRIAIAEAFLRASAPDAADRLLSAHPERGVWTSRAAACLAAARFRQSNVVGARDVMQNRPGAVSDSREIHSLLVALSGQAAPSNGVADVVTAIQKRDPTAATAAAARVAYLPPSLRTALETVAGRAAASAHDAGLAAQALTRAWIEWALGVPGGDPDADWRRIAELVPDAQVELAALRSMAAIDRGDLPRATSTIMPLLERPGSHPAVQYVGACLALENGGIANLAKFVSTLPSPPTDRVIGDLAMRAWQKGRKPVAREVLKRIKSPSAIDRDLIFEVAATEGDANIAASFLSPRWSPDLKWTSNTHEISALWLDARSKILRKESTNRIKAIAESKGMEFHALAPRLVEALLTFAAKSEASILTIKIVRVNRSNVSVIRELSESWTRLSPLSNERLSLEKMVKLLSPQN